MRREFRAPYAVGFTVQLALLGAAIQTSMAHAQLVPSVSAASAPNVDPMERAQRQADNVMRWIKVHSDKPRSTAATSAATSPTVPTAPAVNKTAPTKSAPAVAVATAAPAVSLPAIAPVASIPVASQINSVVPQPVEVPAPVAVAAPIPTAIDPVIGPDPSIPVEEEEDVPLKAISQTQPYISRSVLSSLTSGKVMVRFTVQPDGKTSDVQIISSSSRKLSVPTLAAVSGWRFEPIKAPHTAQVEIDFMPQ